MFANYSTTDRVSDTGSPRTDRTSICSIEESIFQSMKFLVLSMLSRGGGEEREGGRQLSTPSPDERMSESERVRERERESESRG